MANGAIHGVVAPPRWTPHHVETAPSCRSDWEAVPPLLLVRATDGGPLRQATTVRVAWHEASLLVRFECADADAWGTHTERDAPLWTEEAVEVFLAPGGRTPTRYVELEVSPRGALFDAWIDNPGTSRAALSADTSWDCPGIEWRVGRLGPAQDWWAEIRLPLRSVLPEPAPLPDRWRANFYRIERPRDSGLPEEYGAWSPTLRDPPDFHVPEQFGLLERFDPQRNSQSTR
jgi:hypothetical protein